MPIGGAVCLLAFGRWSSVLGAMVRPLPSTYNHGLGGGEMECVEEQGARTIVNSVDDVALSANQFVALSVPEGSDGKKGAS